MACHIDIPEDGIGQALIPDPAGELVRYDFAPAEPRGALWACLVTRLDSGESYRVECVSRRRWRCSCPAWRYRRRGKDPSGCKHTSAVRALVRMAWRLGLRPAPTKEESCRT